jgi:hypothetical protein
MNKTDHPRMMEDGEVFGVDDPKAADFCLNGPVSMLNDLSLCVKSWRSGDIITAICVTEDGASKVVRTFPAAEIYVIPRQWGKP